MESNTIKDYLDNEPLIIPITKKVIIKVNNIFYSDNNPTNLNIEYEIFGVDSNITDDDVTEAKELFEKTFNERIQKSINKYIDK